jgi:hypothetical protein
MPGVGFERTIPVFERAKTIHTLDDAATVIGCLVLHYTIYSIDATSRTQFEDLENYITTRHKLLQISASPYRLNTSKHTISVQRHYPLHTLPSCYNPFQYYFPIYSKLKLSLCLTN